MKKIFLISLILFGCGKVDHNKERQSVCEHIEGFGDSECSANDDFSPLTCETALQQFEGWWRDDAQTAVNDCLSAAACYATADGVPGPSIEVPLQYCLGVELYSKLQPTDAQTQAVSKFCVRAGQCDELGAYTISGCEEVLLNPYADGQLFLMMSDQIANSVAACNTSKCEDFDNCVYTVLGNAGVFDTVMNTQITMPLLMRR